MSELDLSAPQDGATRRAGRNLGPGERTMNSNHDPRKPHAKDANPAASIDFGLFLDCVHCGLCTSACPTYTELGDENDGPRGRIYLMRQVAEGRMGLDELMKRHLDRCLDCRACETACPSGERVRKDDPGETDESAGTSNHSCDASRRSRRQNVQCRRSRFAMCRDCST